MNRLSLCAFLLLPALGFAQYTSNPANPFVVANRTNEQVQPKLAIRSDGGCYVAWFDNAAGGYDVYLQRLDRFGNELWPHNGVLVADRGFSSTEDYDLKVDGQGNAILAFGDDRAGGQTVNVSKVLANGSFGWSTTAASTGSLHAPHVAVLSDGNIVTGYTQDNSYGYSKLDSAGHVIASATFSESGKPYAFSDILASDNGAFIILYVKRFNSNFTSAKSLWSQKYSSGGSALWNGGSPLAIYAPTGSAYGTQGGSIQNGYFPTMIADGAGGAVYAWYEIGGPRDAKVQHVTSNGTLTMPLHGQSVSVSDNSQIRVGCSAAYDEVNDVVYAVAVETNASNQSLYRTLIQKLTGDGTRQWGSAGMTIIAANNNQPSFVQCQTTQNGVSAFGFDSRSATTGVVFDAGFDSNGVAQFGVSSPSYISSINSTKSRLTSANSPKCCHILTWSDGPFGSADVHMNRLNYDGILGNNVDLANDSFVVVDGSLFSGNLASLSVADGNRLRLFDDSDSLVASLEVTTHFGSALHQLECSVTTSAARLGLQKVVSIWNPEGDSFDLLGSEEELLGDSSAFYCDADAVDHILDNGTIRLRVEWAPFNDETPSQDGWLCSADEVHLAAR